MSIEFEYQGVTFVVAPTTVRQVSLISVQTYDMLDAIAKDKGFKDTEELSLTISTLAGKFIALMVCTTIVYGDDLIKPVNLARFNPSELLESFYSWVEATEDEDLYDVWEHCYEEVHQTQKDESSRKNG